MLRNKVLLIGRCTKDADVRATSDGKNVARFTLAVDGYGKDAQADFINCVAFGSQADFAEKFLNKGKKIGIEGKIKTGSYTNKDNIKVYTTDVVVESYEFVESKSTSSDNGFSDIDGLEYDDVELPFV